jgi:hypothetical protein
MIKLHGREYGILYVKQILYFYKNKEVELLYIMTFPSLIEEKCHF